MATPTAILLRSPGTNCDRETTFALEQAGATVRAIHINALREDSHALRDAQILVLPGGFSYGDDVAAGKILANQLQHYLSDACREFRDHEKLILGICNGFQTLLKAGLIAPPDEDGPIATLAHNTHGRFEDRWVTLSVSSHRSPFLKGIERMTLPVAHGEGNFICRKEWILQGLGQAGQIALRYSHPQSGPITFPHNPNGAQGDVAGLCDASGRVFGLMPHPERHILPTQHPNWTRRPAAKEGDGMAIFRNAVAYFNQD